MSGGDDFFDSVSLHTGKQSSTFADRRARLELTPFAPVTELTGLQIIVKAEHFSPEELNFFRHHSPERERGDPQRLGTGVKDRCQFVTLLLIFGEFERLSQLDVVVNLAHEGKAFGNRGAERKFIEQSRDTWTKVPGGLDDLACIVVGLHGGGQLTLEITDDHVGHAAGAVAERVGQIGIVDADKFIMSKVTVGRTEWALRDEVVAEGIE